MRLARSHHARTFLHRALVASVWPVTDGHALPPPETATYKPSTLPGYQLVQKNCMVCHSAQYPSTQPPSMGRAYWEATVKKMKKPFGAQFDDADIPAMVDYLVKTYGNEQPGMKQATAAKPGT